MGKHPGYVFDRSGTHKLWLKLQPPNGFKYERHGATIRAVPLDVGELPGGAYVGKSPRFEITLGTSDRQQAELLSLPYIEAHKRILLDHQPRHVIRWQNDHEPGTSFKEADGTIVAARDRWLTCVAPDGTVTERPNGRMWKVVDPGASPTIHAIATLLAQPEPEQPAATHKPDADELIWQTYLTSGGHKGTGVKGKAEAVATSTWRQWRAFNAAELGNRPLKKCTAIEGRKFAEHLRGGGRKGKRSSGSVDRYLKPLAAACELAVRNAVLDRNPFQKVVADHGDHKEVGTYTDADVVLIKAHLDDVYPAGHRLAGRRVLSEADVLLLRLLALTGMRLSEPWQADGIREKDGVKLIHVGSKTDASVRDVPLPESILAELPATGPLLPGKSQAAGRRLARFLKGIGIGDDKSPNHSWRHRAEARLLALECPDNLSRMIVGHALDVHGQYGKGDRPMKLLKTWVEKIGF
jgi:integrase